MDRKWWTLIAVCTATFMLLLDITIVNVALPAIERDLGADFADLQWVIDAYALTLAALLLTGGSVADQIGRRRVFVIGLIIFTVASVLCGLATSPTTLNLARALQGIGGAFMFATSLALLASTYQGRDRGTALGLWGATTGAAVAVGPLIGGVLTEWIGWEAIFFVNVPIGAFALALTLTRVEESKDPTGGRLDIWGTVTFSGALFLLIFGLIRGNAEDWDGSIMAALAGAAALLVAFVVIERRGREPMLDLALFRRPTFVGASLAAFVLSASMFAMFLYLTLYVQNILGYSALESGLRFMPVTLVSFVAAPISGKLADRLGVRWFIAGGLALVGAGLLLMGGLEAGRRLDRAAGRLPDRRRRHRHRQPGARDGGDRRRRAAPRGDGVGHQLDVPPGRHRDRHRGVGRGLPARRARRVRPRRGGDRAARGGEPRRGARRLHRVRRRPAQRRPQARAASPSRRSWPASTTFSCWRGSSRFAGAALCAVLIRPAELAAPSPAVGARAASASG